MTGRYCDQHNGYEERRMRMMMRRIAWACLGLIVAVAFVVFLVWAILHPHGPRFVLQDVTINDFNVSQPNFLSSNLQVTVSSRNPNDKIGIFYDRLDIYVTYRNQEVTLARLLPSTYQGHLEVTVWSPFLIGSAVPVAPYLSSALNEDLFAGLVLLNIKIDGWVRWKVGSWVSGSYRLHVNCPAFITVTGKLTGTGPAIKYQLVQRCAVDV
ncbi:NDR1/HIN1-like protein [Arabidopsis thaliana]|uniref:Late embryogenesis abundant (LEA) hydroxyproline-rich glycoprotein family n=1 Tax=Arabidopsis thaliana TaxID=3702 RepID=Q9C568_ARATH|nr:Late embryogenesis abundant (LEA) hydroxyproline-rich glycoprotein family [Arabidopsis thaliana]AED92995.1 Late embryogenesis abundant (LEA) hydroxyproline-rich glycoprotein family [Arabidopsis thaliana]CAC34513.1 NDR1/HIN1-like protein [Arabidopsis thaliana]|eukprot:NP_680206.1 Late embryogenesis abundant (LEA) hydroxyproline-rich glycoprotein family [Arabidopsis thaliana]